MKNLLAGKRKESEPQITEQDSAELTEAVADTVAESRKETCFTCAYSFVTNIRKCRRYPPIATVAEFTFTVVKDTDWCGEYKRGR